MSTEHIVPLEPGNRIQLPAEWADALGLHAFVTLDRTAEGILVRPCRQATWEEIFATKLVIGSAPRDQNEQAVEVTGDDFVF
jgi:hypothetical protein